MSPSVAKRLSNLSIAIALGAVCVAGCCQDSKETATVPLETFPQIPDYKVQIKSVSRAFYETTGWGTVYTIEHDGHMFVVLYPDAIMHHPDCPCLKGLKKIEFENSTI